MKPVEAYVIEGFLYTPIERWWAVIPAPDLWAVLSPTGNLVSWHCSRGCARKDRRAKCPFGRVVGLSKLRSSKA